MLCTYIDVTAVALVILAKSVNPCLCNLTSEKFARKQGQKVDQSYMQVDGTSAIGCVVACGSDDMCMAVSYHSQQEVCLLSKYRPRKDKVTNISDWTTYPKGSCPSGWILYDNSCYLFVNEGKSWLQAETYCQEHGGNLVTIETQAENEFISDHVKPSSHCWIGLNDRASEGTYVWASDGSKVVFTSWDSGEPGNSAGENCIVTLNYSGRWHDYNCNGMFYSVCEM